MKIRKVLIENFRGIKKLELDLDDVTVLIGENNSGKTAVLEALRLCLRELGPRRRNVFDTYDFHLKDAAAEPSSSDPIRVEVTFSEDAEGDWSDKLVGSLNRQKILQVANDGRRHVLLRVTCAYEITSRDFNQGWEFLNLDRQPLKNITDTALGTLQHEVAYYYLAALRDAARHFDAKGPFWRPFLKDSQLPPEKRSEIEQKLREVNDLVVASHTSFEQARDRLNKVQDVVPMTTGDIVSIEAVPGRLFDMLAKAEIHLGTTTGAKVPVGRHGEGTQSLAVLMLFSAFLDLGEHGAPIVALEEPEAHLHPSAIRAMWAVVASIAGQKLISTHSGDLLSEVPILAIRRLARGPSGIFVRQLHPTTLNPDDERKLNFHIRQSRGELLFARCWLLVEGETEVILLSEIARHKGINLERCGIRLVPQRQLCGIESLLKVARDLGISWCVLTDNDQQGAADQRHVESYRAGANISDILFVMQEADIERHLCENGFGAVYEARLSHQTRPSVTVQKGHPDYWNQVCTAIKKGLVKPAAAIDVINLIRAGNVPIPSVLESAISAAVRLAEVL